MSRHPVLDLARALLPAPSPTAKGCLACLAAAPPEDLPDGPAAEDLARTFVRAFVSGDVKGLPPGLASHLDDWLSFPDDFTPVLLVAWRRSGSVAEVAYRLRTDPDQVLYLADGLRKRGVGLPATPGVKWSR
jgi:hypothetical protein